MVSHRYIKIDYVKKLWYNHKPKEGSKNYENL